MVLFEGEVSVEKNCYVQDTHSHDLPGYFVVLVFCSADYRNTRQPTCIIHRFPVGRWKISCCSIGGAHCEEESIVQGTALERIFVLWLRIYFVHLVFRCHKGSHFVQIGGDLIVIMVGTQMTAFFLLSSFFVVANLDKELEGQKN